MRKREKLSRKLQRALNHSFYVYYKIFTNSLDTRSIFVYIDRDVRKNCLSLHVVMKTSRKILILWGILAAIYGLTLLLFPHRSASLSSLMNRSIQALLFFISLFILLREPNAKNRFIFLNFVLFFSLCIFQLGHDFVGKLFFKDIQYATHLYLQYFWMAYIFLDRKSVV